MNITKYIFALVGAGLLVGAFFLYKNTADFTDIALSAQGIVIDQAESWDDEGSTYFPVVEFTTQQSDQYTFESSFGSNPPSYDIGEKVLVLYNPESPEEAKIDSFFSLWFGTILVSVLGIIFFLVGTLSIISQIRKNNV